MSVFHVPAMSASDHQRAAGALARLPGVGIAGVPDYRHDE